jgi:hypothetical protein
VRRNGTGMNAQINNTICNDYNNQFSQTRRGTYVSVGIARTISIFAEKVT